MELLEKPKVKPIGKKEPRYDFANCPTRVHHSGPYVYDDVIAAIKATNGNFHEMGLLLDRRRSSIRDFVFSNLAVREFYEEICESQLDRCEQTLFELALNGDAASLRFILSTKGKDRGYATTISHTGKDDGPLKLEIKLHDDQQVKENKESELEDFLKGVTFGRS